MKKSLLLLVLLLCNMVYAQTTDDVGRVSVNVYQPQRENLTDEACKLLTTKMQSIISANGIADRGINERFVMTAKVNVTEKNIVSGSPSRVSQKIEVTFIVGDVVENKIYATQTVSATGIGLNENKSFISAISSIKPNNSLLQSFMTDAKERIVQYYQDNCEGIFAEANRCVATQQYNKALYILAQIPDVCRDCYTKSQSMMVDIWRMNIDFEGERLLNMARTTWAQSPNAETAGEAADILGRINTSAKCWPDAQILLDSIQSKVIADEKYEREVQRQQYEDAKAREQRDFEFRKQQYEDKKAADAARAAAAAAREQREYELRREQARINAEHERQAIAAAREVALEFAKNQPKNVTYNNRISSW